MTEFRALSHAESACGRLTLDFTDACNAYCRTRSAVKDALTGAAERIGADGHGAGGMEGDDSAWQRVRLQAFVNSGGRIRL